MREAFGVSLIALFYGYGLSPQLLRKPSIFVRRIITNQVSFTKHTSTLNSVDAIKTANHLKSPIRIYNEGSSPYPFACGSHREMRVKLLSELWN